MNKKIYEPRVSEADERTDRERYDEWRRQVAEAEQNDWVHPNKPNIDWAALAVELEAEANDFAKSLKKAREEREAFKQGMEVNQADAYRLKEELDRVRGELEDAKASASNWLDKYKTAYNVIQDHKAEIETLQSGNADLLAKAESLLSQKNALERDRDEKFSFWASESEKRKAAERAREEALKELQALKGQLLSEQLMGAHLRGYIEGIEAAAEPPTQTIPKAHVSVYDRFPSPSAALKGRGTW